MFARLFRPLRIGPVTASRASSPPPPC